MNVINFHLDHMFLVCTHMMLSTDNQLHGAQSLRPLDLIYTSLIQFASICSEPTL